jgi:hypothetical protein
VHLAIATSNLRRNEVSLRLFQPLALLFVAHQNTDGRNDLPVNVSDAGGESLWRFAWRQGRRPDHEGQGQELCVSFPFYPPFAEPPYAVISLAGGGYLFQPRQVRRDWRRSVFADDGDMPNVGVAIEVEGGPCVELVVQFSSQ